MARSIANQLAPTSGATKTWHVSWRTSATSQLAASPSAITAAANQPATATATHRSYMARTGSGPARSTARPSIVGSPQARPSSTRNGSPTTDATAPSSPRCERSPRKPPNSCSRQRPTSPLRSNRKLSQLDVVVHDDTDVDVEQLFVAAVIAAMLSLPQNRGDMRYEE